MMRFLISGCVFWVMWGCSPAAPPAEAPAPTEEKTTPPSPPEVERVDVSEGNCDAPEDRCCLPDGTLVRPGGCSSIYPRGVEPATVRGSNGFCERIPCRKKCLPETAHIDTPQGARRVSALTPGDSVYTLNTAGEKVVSKVLRVVSVPVTESAPMVRLRLADGRSVVGSAGHPTAKARAFGELRIGDSVDGAQIVGIEPVLYTGSHTWDLLPAGDTGSYGSHGVQIGSTLR